MLYSHMRKHMAVVFAWGQAVFVMFSNDQRLNPEWCEVKFRLQSSTPVCAGVVENVENVDLCQKKELGGHCHWPCRSFPLLQKLLRGPEADVLSYDQTYACCVFI